MECDILILQFFVLVSFLEHFSGWSQTIYLFLCIQPNLRLVPQVENTEKVERLHVVLVNVWAFFLHGLWKGVSTKFKSVFCRSVFVGGTMHLVRVRNFGVVLLQSKSPSTPFHLLFLLLTDIWQSASLLSLMAVSPLGDIDTNSRRLRRPFRLTNSLRHACTALVGRKSHPNH